MKRIIFILILILILILNGCATAPLRSRTRKMVYVPKYNIHLSPSNTYSTIQVLPGVSLKVNRDHKLSLDLRH